MTEQTTKPSQRRQIPADIPIVEYDHSRPATALAHFDRLHELAAESKVWWNDHGPGFWMVMEYEWVKEAYQNAEVFTSDSILATDPNPTHKWIPTMTAGADHLRYRQLLNKVFSPAAVAAHEERSRAAVNRIIDRLEASGRAEMMRDFCGEVPCEIFLGMIGLPMSDAPQMAIWVGEVFDHMHDLDGTRRNNALGEIGQYFQGKLDDWRRRPDDEVTDVVGMLARADYDGRPLEDHEILNICNTLALAGLDTVRSQLGHTFLHLATHPEDRARVVADPSLWPSTIEESLRYYAIVSNDGRKLSQDIDFHGCPMKKGDMVMLSLAPACRDAATFPDPDHFDVAREPNRHIAFAAGPHRCLGSHLARMEMLVALEEWHKRIPDYRLSAGSPGPERGAQMSLVTLGIEWER